MSKKGEGEPLATTTGWGLVSPIQKRETGQCGHTERHADEGLLIVGSLNDQKEECLGPEKNTQMLNSSLLLGNYFHVYC